jgi:uncharacterized protein YraI
VRYPHLRTAPTLSRRSTVKRSLKTRSRAAAVVVATALAFGGSVATAPAASAVGASKCDHNYTDGWWYLNTSGVSFRTGPSTDYTRIGVLYTSDRIWVTCGYWGGDNIWMYGKRQSNGTWGWVHSNYVNRVR